MANWPNETHSILANRDEFVWHGWALQQKHVIENSQLKISTGIESHPKWIYRFIDIQIRFQIFFRNIHEMSNDTSNVWVRWMYLGIEGIALKCKQTIGLNALTSIQWPIRIHNFFELGFVDFNMFVAPETIASMNEFSFLPRNICTLSCLEVVWCAFVMSSFFTAVYSCEQFYSRWKIETVCALYTSLCVRNACNHNMRMRNQNMRGTFCCFVFFLFFVSFFYLGYD